MILNKLVEVPFGAKIKEFKIKTHELKTYELGPDEGGSTVFKMQDATGYLLRSDFSSGYICDDGSLGRAAWLFRGQSKVWWISLSPEDQTIGSSFSATATIKRFGAFGADEETHTQTVSLTNWGQPSGAPRIYPVPFTTLSERTTLKAIFASAMSDGSQALFRVCLWDVYTGYVWNGNWFYPQMFGPVPFGWLLFDVSENEAGVPEITASLLYDRATTIGTRSQTITDGRTEEQLCTGISFYVLMDIGTYTVSETITDWIVAAYYDELDALVVRKISAESEWVVETENLNPGASGCDSVPLLIAHSTSTQTITYDFQASGGDPITQTATFTLEADYTAIAPYGQEIRVGTGAGDSQGDWSAEMDGVSVSGTFGATLSNSGFGVKISASTFGEMLLKQGETDCCPSDGCVAATTNDLDIDDAKINTFRVYGNRFLVYQFTGMSLYGDYASGTREPRLLISEKIATPNGAYDPQATWVYPESQLSVRLAWDAENQTIGRSTTSTIYYV